MGTPGARPAIALHGGPGAGASPLLRQLFDPARFDLLLFDQRGCGRSLPRASIHANTTQHLISDIERLRTEVAGVNRWMVYGGSWGSLLGLAYAQAHPQPVDSLVLRGMFTCTKAELDWFYRSGLNLVFPDKWERFLAPVPYTERDDLLKAYGRLLNHSDEVIRFRAAKAWCTFESEISKFDTVTQSPGQRPDDQIKRP